MTNHTIVVYRIETASGDGPYFSSLAIGGALDYSPSQHPEPFEDGIEDFTSKHLCGFESIEQCENWFSVEDLKILHDTEDFYISSFRIDPKNVLFGNRQIMFKLSDTLEKNTHSIESMFY